MASLPASSALERPSTAARVASYLRRRITEGAIKPGERLNELALASELGVSRSPIREALGRLAAEGVARVVPYKGTFVTPLSRAHLQDLLEFRIALEQFALRRVIERAKPQDFTRFERLIEKLRASARARDFSAAVDADLRMHQLLVELAGSPLLERTFGELLGEFRLYIAATSRHYKLIGDLAEEHEALFHAMRRRNVDKALALIAKHITHGFTSALKELV